MFEAQWCEVRISSEAQDAHDVVVRSSPAGPLPADPNEQAAAGIAFEEVPLRIERDSIGSLRLALPDRDALSALELALLHDAAEQAALSIRRAQLYEEEHRVAVELQRGLLPKHLPDVPGVRIAAHYEAAGGASEVGGDWYDAFALPGGRLGVVLGDVAGRGIQAASTMGQLRSVTRAFAVAGGEADSPAAVLTRLNRYQLSLAEDQLFTVVYAIVDPQRSLITWANAGHLPPLLLGGGETCYLEGGGYPMAIADVVYHDMQRPLVAGGGLVLYTDGLVERREESIDAGLERLEAMVRSGPDAPAAMLTHVLAGLLPEGNALHDDVTAVAVRW
jgi:serine phosphatase RsbU (regulator of sigma subunit)